MTRSCTVAMVVAMLAGCPRSRPTPPPAAGSGSSCAGLPRNEMPRNEMPRNEMPRNGLSAKALAHNAPLLATLAAAPFEQGLDQAMLGGFVPTLAAYDDHETRKLLKYIAACALDPCEQVTAGRTLANGTRDDLALTGELGLCGDHYNAWAAKHGAPAENPWRGHVPSAACKQRISACVLARVNAIGASIRISLRGDGMSLGREVSVDTIFRENHGTPIHSFAACAARGITSSNPARNCGWAPRHVGRCSRGTGATPSEITVAAAGRIRICEGVHGCDDPVAKDMTPLFDGVGAALTSPPRYGGWMLATGRDHVTFACPANGPLIGNEQTGYYAVMVDPTSPPDVAVTATLPSSLDEYPGSEGSVFTYREGAFFGTLFTPFGPPELPTMILAGEQYACYSSLWTEGEAMLADRLCARETPKLAACFANKPGPCETEALQLGWCKPEPPRVPRVPRVEDDCHAETKAWPTPYTTYLNHPCDLSPTDERCITRLSAPWLRTQILNRDRP